MKNNQFNLNFLYQISKDLLLPYSKFLFSIRYEELVRQINRSPIKLRQNFYIVFISVWNVKQKVTVSDVFYYSSIDDPLGLQLPKRVASSNPQLEIRKQAKITIQGLYQPNSFVQLKNNKFFQFGIFLFFFIFFIKFDKTSKCNNFIPENQLTTTSIKINGQQKWKLDSLNDGIVFIKNKNIFKESVVNKLIDLNSPFLLQKQIINLQFHKDNSWLFIPMGINFENNDTIFNSRNLGFSIENKSNYFTEIWNKEFNLLKKTNENSLIEEKYQNKFLSILFLPYFLKTIPIIPTLILWWSYKFDSEKKNEIKIQLKQIQKIEKTNIYNFVQKQVTFRDIGGMDALKKELSTVAFLLRKKEYSKNYPTGYLFAGPPGTGKTLMAKAMAYEAQTPYLYVEGSQFQDQEMGIANARVDDLFQQIKTLTPCILYIDEIDSIGEKREESDMELERLEKITNLMEGKKDNTNKKPSDTILMQFLIYLDGYTTRKDLVIIGATNRLDILDDALMRPGRFDRQILFTPPFFQERLDILKIFFSSKNFIEKEKQYLLAERSIGLNGCDLRLLIDNLLFLSSFEQTKSINFNEQSIVQKNKRLNESKFNIKDIDLAFERISRVRHNITDYNLFFNKNDFLRTAYHEVGRAFTQILLPECSPTYSLHLFPKPFNERFLEIEKQKINIPSIDIIGTNNIDYFLQKIIGCLAGRAIETVAFKSNSDEVSTYLNKPYDPDLYMAYKLTKQIAGFGLIESLSGLVNHSITNQSKNLGFEKAFSLINSFIKKRVLNKTNTDFRKMTKTELQKLDYQEFWYDQDYPWEFDFVQNLGNKKTEKNLDIDIQTIFILQTLFIYLTAFLESHLPFIDHLVVRLLREKTLSKEDMEQELQKYGIEIPKNLWKAW
jgi:ATP-dependent Zn protease